MELKVWVEGIQRIICGVTVNTTCQDVVFALAHATGKVGRFTLIERWRNNERLLAPNENPLKLLLKWGEYANDVQFILQRSDQTAKQRSEPDKHPQQPHLQHQQQQQQPALPGITGVANVSVKKNVLATNNGNIISDAQTHGATDFLPLDRCKELPKSFSSVESKQIENVGIVKGIPQRLPSSTTSPPSHFPSVGVAASPIHNTPHELPPKIIAAVATEKHEKSHTGGSLAQPQFTLTQTEEHISSGITHIYQQIDSFNATPNEINLAEVRNSLDRRTNVDPHGTNDQSTMMMVTNSNENLLDIFNGNDCKYSAVSATSVTPHNTCVTPDLYKNSPPISSNGALVPPPYRDPPRPRNSPLQQQQTKLHDSSGGSSSGSSSVLAAPTTTTGSMVNNNFRKYDDATCTNPFICEMDADFHNSTSTTENLLQAAQYKDLLQLIKFQREKITLQQSELTKYDAEIVYLENKERDQAQELEAISREITKADQIFRQGSEQLQTLQYVEEENELVKQQEKTLKSEIALLRSKLANCETELLQCKNKVRILMDDIQIEQRAVNNRQKDNRQNVERDFLIEMERIQTEIDQAIHNTDSSNKATENLKKEILLIENAIAEKKRQVEQLVNEMKEVNLQSLAVTPSDEIRNLLEGSNKPGSSRRIIGSPRQLENAVPTSKNPHGVWV